MSISASACPAPPFAAAEVEEHPVGGHAGRLGFQAVLDLQQEFGRGQGQGLAAGAGIAAAGGAQHEQPGTTHLRRLAHADEAVVRHFQVGRELLQRAFGVLRHLALAHQLAAGRHDALEPMPAGLAAAKLVVGPAGRGEHGEQLVARQLALGLVVVDVVAADGLDFRRIAGLTGAQHDAQIDESQFAPDRRHDVQPGGQRLHHHIEEDDGDVGFAAQAIERFVRRVGVQELHRAVEHFQPAQGQDGRFVDVLIVIDDQNAPRMQRHLADLLALLGEEEVVVVRGLLAHRASPWIRLPSG